MRDSERRLAPRLSVDLPVAVDTATQSAPPDINDLVRLIDLSIAGGQLACNYLAACRIVPRSRSLVDAVGIQSSLRIGFDGSPPEDDAPPFPVAVTYSRRLSQDDYRFGVRFETLDTPQLERLKRFLNNS